MRVVENELDACLDERCRTWLLREMAQAEVEATKATAARGLLSAPDEHPATPVRLDPELWELRWTIEGSELRMYHSEPPTRSEMLLALKVHWKWLGKGASQDEIDRRQDVEMQDASDRYVSTGLHPSR